MDNSTGCIGVFDSGIGGLTVAKAIHELLPNENLIYFGDTAHLPYGDKTPSLIKKYSKRITDFLLENKVKAIVIACNSASAHAKDDVVKLVGDKVPIIDVISPTVDLTYKLKMKNIGVIGTKATIGSKVYKQEIRRRDATINVFSLATPLLVPMIEEGFIYNDISDQIIKTYLDDDTLNNIECLILGCTHYPLIKKEIEDLYKNDVTVIDSASNVAIKLKEVLDEINMLNLDRNQGVSHKFFVSSFTDSFEASAKHFFGSEIHLEERNVTSN